MPQKKAREDIQLQAISSKKEVEDAQMFLAEAEKRWEVIDVDADEESTPTKNDVSNKKRKVSLSPQGNSNSNNGNGSDVVTTNSNGRNSQSQGDVFHDCLDHNGTAGVSGSAAVASSNNRLFNVNQIVVEGCGTSFTNGTYNRIADMYNGAPVYIKENSTTMAIFRHFFSVPNRNAWSIGQWSINSVYSGSPGVIFYRDANDNSSLSIAPPGNDWEPVGGIYPLPKCRLIANNDQSNQSNNSQVSTSDAAGRSNTSLPHNVDRVVVEGCGNPQFNGTYEKEVGRLHNGASLYIKRNSNDNIAIYREDSGSSWGIGWWWDIPNIPVLAYYTSPNNANNSLIPSENNWETARGVYPPPKCRFQSSSADQLAQTRPIPNEIDVVGAAIQSINGTYKRDEDEDRNGHPTYYKLGTLDGVLKEFIIYRAEGNNRFWYIGIPDENKKFYMVRCDFSPDKRLPPKSDWVISIHGQSPSPNLQY